MTWSTGQASYTGSRDVGLPQVAQSRIQHIAAAGGATGSLLANSDYLTLHDAGLEPIGAVVGVSVVHLGQFQLAGLRAPVELEAFSQAITLGYGNAFTRMRQEAAELGADGVFLQKSNSRRFDGEEHEYSCRGTALRFRPQPGALRAPTGLPFLANCTAMSLYQYLRRGLCPVSFEYHACVYHVPHRTMRQALGQTFQNTEVPVFTEGWYTAREIALSRLQMGLEQAGAELILGMGVDEEEGAFGEHTAEFRAYGRGWRHVPGLAGQIPNVDLTGPSLIDRDNAYPITTLRGDPQ
jgi:uncharacterized protein YbjQ (UPF0145 family)